MSKQNKMSIKQVVKNEYKLILLLSAIVLFLPVLSELIVIFDLNAFINLSALDKIDAILNPGTFEMTNVNTIIYTGAILNYLLLPVFAAIIAYKLNGSKLGSAFNKGIQSIGTKKFWNYVLKVYLPYWAVVIVLALGLYFTPDTVMLNFITNLIQSTALLTIVCILVIIVSIIISTIAGCIFVANIAYLRDDATIKQVFNSIPTREISKIILLFFSDLVIGALFIGGFWLYISSMQPLALLGGIFGIAINVLVVLIIKQIIFGVAAFILYVNVASKIDTKTASLKIEQNKAINQNKAISQGEDVAQTKEDIRNVFETEMKPKKANRKNRIKRSDLEEKKVKPKRSIK
ncbi:hypothetical protein R2F61_01685 [Mollicutes bacterium LVI A0078]|nr:hypothetical protein RZE84_01680 [Mollicutes bacterium LVI A0075]WOO91287.1 hypothetical protein R2F61_01685 [Mollicutes bacterium LVI A0078]